jgi:putative ubiquitin-RnfH superfamily antitoxin RatB of RatAB toxin-antitoxin module
MAAAALLATGRGVRETAAEVGAGERTVHTWLDDFAFRRLVTSMRDRALSETLGRLSEAASAAVETLRSLLDDAPPQVRARAALGILDTLVKARESVELADRVELLERELGVGDAAVGPHHDPDED